MLRITPNRSNGFPWGEDNTMEMEPCFYTYYEENSAERPLEPMMSL